MKLPGSEVLIHAFISIDGEAVQMRILLTAVFVLLLNGLRILMGKTPRSCSGITQASDISDEFKAEKKALKFVSDKDYGNAALRYHLQEVFATRHSFTAEYKELLVVSMLQLVHASKVVVNQRIVSNGYSKFGQVGGALDFWSIIKACRSFIPPEMKQLMFDNLQHFVSLMRANHGIKESEYDEKKIISVNLPGTIPAEQLVIYRRRELLIKGQVNIDDYNERATVRIQASELRETHQLEAKNRKKAQELAKAQEIVTKFAEEQKKLEDKIEKRNLKIQKKEEDRLEKIRISALPVAERRALKLHHAEMIMAAALPAAMEIDEV